MSLGKVESNTSSFIVCDRTNTTESADGPSTTSGRGSSTTPHKSNVGAIAGGVVGGCLLLLTIGLTLCLYQRHRNIAPEVTPFHTPAIPILSERTPTLIANNQRVLHDMDIPPTPLLLSEKSPSTTDITSLNPNPLTATSESSSLREQVMNLRVELDALRSRKSSSTPSQSTTTRHPPSSITTPLKSEIALLREELSQIKARQDREQTPTRPSIPPVNEGLIREVASLRAELEEMRSQQELVQLGDLPRYSPPPPNSAFMSALPSSAGVRPYGH